MAKKFTKLNLGDVAYSSGRKCFRKLSPGLFRIVNPLEGSSTSELVTPGTFTVYQYEFENGVPSTVTLNEETSNTSITQVILTYDMKVSTITVYVSGLVEIYCPVGYHHGSDITGTLECNVVFTTSNNQKVSDSFIARGLIIEQCFAQGTLILTPTGFKKIEEIQEGDNISSYNFLTNSVEDDEVTYFSLQNGDPNVHYITFSNGNRIGVTPTHAFMTDSGWKCISPNDHTPDRTQLKIGDKVQTVNNTYTEVLSIESDPIPQPVYHLSLANNSCVLVASAENNEAVIAEHLNTTDFGIMMSSSYQT